MLCGNSILYYRLCSRVVSTSYPLTQGLYVKSSANLKGPVPTIATAHPSPPHLIMCSVEKYFIQSGLGRAVNYKITSLRVLFFYEQLP